MPVVEEFCTITAKGQTTVPKAVRRPAGVRPGAGAFADAAGGRHCRPTGSVVRPFTPALVGRLEALAGELGEVDPDAAIEGEVAL